VDSNVTFGMNVCSLTCSQLQAAKTHVFASLCKRFRMRVAIPPLLSMPSYPVA
jgi:hypothetical protein